MYQFTLNGLVTGTEVRPMGTTGKNKLVVNLEVGGDKYKNIIPIDFLGDDAKKLHSSLKAGATLEVRGYVGSFKREHQGKTFYNIGLTGKDITLQQVVTQTYAQAEPFAGVAPVDVAGLDDPGFEPPF